MGIGRFATVTFWTASIAAGTPEGDLRITVRVYDYAGLPAGTLAKAGLEARKIFAKSGIETEWVECPLERGVEERYPACRKPISPADVSIRIMPHSTEGYPVPPWAFGFALSSGDGRPATHAYIFNRRVEEVLREAKCARFQLLGFAMAHEVGHLLLGPAAHASRGIMRSRWLKEELRQVESGALIFTSEQAVRLRASIRARLRDAAYSTATGSTLLPVP